MRIAIVNDVGLIVKALQMVLSQVPGYEIAWVASDGAEAVKKCSADTPDLILMDLLMPVIDGVEATRQIMANSPCAILVVTATVSGNASKVFEAMGYGALDAVNTPGLGGYGNTNGSTDLLAKIATISKLVGKSTVKQERRQPVQTKSSLGRNVPSLVVIGSSTGGPKALAEILSNLPKNFPAGIVIIQHVDAQFATGMVEWLNSQTPLTVQVAIDGDQVQEGKVLMAASNDHLVCTANLTLRYTPHPRELPYRPSVDVFFSSIADHWPDKGTGIVLTGMGRDGGEGLSLLRSAGWHTIAQDKQTSVVYGMPKAAFELGGAKEVLPIGAIAPALLKLVTSTKR